MQPISFSSAPANKVEAYLDKVVVAAIDQFVADQWAAMQERSRAGYRRHGRGCHVASSLWEGEGYLPTERLLPALARWGVPAETRQEAAEALAGYDPAEGAALAWFYCPERMRRRTMQTHAPLAAEMFGEKSRERGALVRVYPERPPEPEDVMDEVVRTLWPNR